jgi:histidyl-tRNA synthetase
VLVLGPDELAAGEVQLKDLQSGEQQRVGRERLVEMLRGYVM